MDETETDDESLVGDIAHIVAESDDGPRANPAMAVEKRNKYANLLLLCKVDHKRVDDQPGEYTVDCLREMKRAHEAWVREALSAEDQERLRAQEVYASLIDDWLTFIRPEEWYAWSSFMLGAGGHSMRVEDAERLGELGEWLLARVWPHKYATLEQAMENFRRVLNDLLAQFYKHAEERGGALVTPKFYKAAGANHALYEQLSSDYDHHVGLVEDLVLELTRAANYVFDTVRLWVDPSFRTREGVLLVQTGPFADLSFKTLRVEYEPDERAGIPYPGLPEFESVRFKRDAFLGQPPEGTEVNRGVEDPE